MITIKDLPKEVRSAIKKKQNIMLDIKGVIYVIDAVENCVMIIKRDMTTIFF